MTRIKLVLAAVVAVAVVALVAGVPVSQAQTSCGTGCNMHFVGAGSSAQFQMAAIAADQAALTSNGNSKTTVFHWTKKYKSSTGDGAYLSDNRNSNIVNQTGNVWVVWVASSNTASPTDVWLDVSVDSTVGNRCVLAQETNGSGCQVQITSAAGTVGDGIVNSALYPDNNADTNLPLSVLNAVNTSVSGGVHVNVGLTDIRPEDAEYATKERMICTAARGTTNTCLGDQIAKNVGGDIISNQGTGAFAQPVGFSLPGEKDPFNTTIEVPTTFTTYELGAAPIIFIANNSTGTPFALNLVSGVTPGEHIAGQPYPLANLWDGSTSCDTDSIAFGGNGDGLGTPLTVFLREPLSGTMNTTEFSLFRSDGNADDTQEGANGGAAMTFTGGAAGTGVACNGTGLRSRAIGTGEVVGSSSPAYGVLGTPYSIGYIFAGWSNNSKFKGGSTYNYLTLDGVDPFFAAPTAYSVCVGGTTAGQVCGTAETCGGGGTCTPGGSTAQTVPYCNSTNCTSDLWDAYTDANTGYTVPAGVTYPNIRNGLYKAWSIYRWVTTATSDPYGPSLVSQEAQNYVDGDVADFVPFSACAPGTGSSCLPANPTDGLAVYRSHFKPTGVTEVCTPDPDNGAASGANLLDGGNSLGGGPECGGDVGGLINGGTQAAFGTNSPTVMQITWKSTLTAHKGYQITHKNGDAFTNLSIGEAVAVTCTGSSGAQATTVTTVEDIVGADFYLTAANPTTPNTFVCRLVAGNSSHTAATTPGVLSKKQ